MTIKTFIKECQDKDVLKLISIYLVSTWVLLQVMSVIWEPIGLPQKSVTVLILLLLTAFPFYLYYIYRFRIETDVTPDHSTEQVISMVSFKKMYFSTVSIISVLCAFGAVLIVKANFFNNDIPEINMVSTNGASDNQIIDASDKIAVLKFTNNTSQESLDVLGKMAADWIIQGINEKQVAQVISAETILEYSRNFSLNSETDQQQILSQYIKPSKIITGSYFQDKDKLVLQASITDGKTSDVLISFKPQYCNQDNSLDCVESLKQLIMSYLFLEDKDKSLRLQHLPPKFSAYQDLLEAKTITDDPERHLKLLNRAITVDPSYFEPQVLRVAHYYGMGDFKTADSLRKTIKLSSYDNKRQTNLLDHYEAVMAGKNDQVYSTVLKEYILSPQDPPTNSTTMTIAQQYVNKPEDVHAIFEVIPMKDIDLENCGNCIIRYYVNSLADIELGNYKMVIDSLKPINENLGNRLLTQSLIAAFIRSNQPDEVTQLLEARQFTSDPNMLAGMHLFAGREALLVEDLAFAKANLSKTIELLKGSLNKNLLRAYMYDQDYSKALPLVKELLKSDPNNAELQSTYAVIIAKNGNQEKASKIIATLEASKTVYDYGAIDYQIARYYIMIDIKGKALNLLRESVANGNIFTSRTFQNDPYFKPLIDTDEFKNLMAYWH